MSSVQSKTIGVVGHPSVRRTLQRIAPEYLKLTSNRGNHEHMHMHEPTQPKQTLDLRRTVTGLAGVYLGLFGATASGHDKASIPIAFGAGFLFMGADALVRHTGRAISNGILHAQTRIWQEALLHEAIFNPPDFDTQGRWDESHPYERLKAQGYFSAPDVLDRIFAELTDAHATLADVDKCLEFLVFVDQQNHLLAKDHPRSRCLEDIESVAIEKMLIHALYHNTLLPHLLNPDERLIETHILDAHKKFKEHY